MSELITPPADIIPVQTTDNPNEIINPIPLVAEETPMPIEGEVADRQIEVLDPTFDPLTKAPDEVLALMDKFGREVANTPENATPVRLAGMITVHAVFRERMRRELLIMQQENAVKEDGVAPRFTKKYE